MSSARRIRSAGFVLLTLFAAFALIAYSRQAAANYIPSFDFAVTESYTLYATKGQLFLGPYSRFGWNHPGPLLFYLFAPFYVTSGHRSAGLSAAAVAINLGSLAVIVGIPFWLKKYRLAAVAAILAAAYTWRIQTILASQWNPHVLVLPTLALLVLSAALASGILTLLPAVAALSTFLVQTHIGAAPTVIPTAGIAACLALFSTHRAATRDDRLRRVILLLTCGLLLLLWLLPIAEQLRTTPGNMTKLWRYFVLDERSGVGFRSAFAIWSEMLSGLFRPDFERAWGGRYEAGALIWPRLWAAIQVFALAGVALRAAAQQDRFRAALAALLCSGSLLALWSVSRINADDLYGHAVFWMSGIGVLNAAVIVDAVLMEISSRMAFRTNRLAAIVCGAAFVGASAIAVQQLRVVVSRSFRPGIEELAARRLSDAIEPSLGPGTKPLIRIDSAIWPVAAGVILQLQKDRVPFAVEQSWISMFTPAAQATGDETHTLAFVRRAERDQLAHEPRSTVIAERDSIFVVLTKP